MEYDGSVVAVAGAAGGIGAAVARAFAQEGAQLVLLDLPGERLERVSHELRELGAEVRTIAVDVRRPEQVVAAAQEIDAPIHAFISALGVLHQGRVDELSVEAFDELLAVNVRGVWLMIRALLPKLAEEAAIVTLGSVAAYAGSDGSWAYTLTKGAVISMTYGLAQELAPRGIRVNAISPGWVDAGFTHAMVVDEATRSQVERAATEAHVLGRMARPEEVAQGVLYLASPRRASFVTGTNLFVDGGFMVKR